MLHRRCSILPVGVTPLNSHGFVANELLSLWGTTPSNPASHTKQQIGSDLMILTIVMSTMYVIIPDDSLYDNTWQYYMFGSCWLILFGQPSVTQSKVLPSAYEAGKASPARAWALIWSGWLLCASFSQGSGHQVTLKAKNHHGYLPKGTCCYQRHIYPGLSMLSLHLAFCSHQTIIGFSCASNISNASEQWSAWRTCCWSLADWKSSVGVPLHRQQSDRLACWGGWWDFVGYL